MPESAEVLKTELLKPPKSMRAEIALHYLIDSLDEPGAALSEAEIEEAWLKESLSRLEAYRQPERPARRISEQQTCTTGYSRTRGWPVRSRRSLGFQ